MDGASELVVFTLGERQFALPLGAVERVIHAVEVTPLPKAPPLVLGVINVAGRVLPVLDIRERFGQIRRQLALPDQLLITRAAGRVIALLTDSVGGLLHCEQEEVITAGEILFGLEYVRGVVKCDADLILLCDLDEILSHEEEKTLDDALGRA